VSLGKRRKSVPVEVGGDKSSQVRIKPGDSHAGCLYHGLYIMLDIFNASHTHTHRRTFRRSRDTRVCVCGILTLRRRRRAISCVRRETPWVTVTAPQRHPEGAQDPSGCFGGGCCGSGRCLGYRPAYYWHWPTSACAPSVKG